MPIDQNFQHVANGINLVPNATTKVAAPGDIDYDLASGNFNLFTGAGATTISTANGVQTLTNKTIAVSSNHITGTLNRAAQFNSVSGDLEASSVTNIELGFVSGVTSSIQSQLNGKQGTVSIGALDAQVPNAQGLALVSNVLSAQSADATHPGLVNNTTQSFSGNKTFTGTISASNLSGTNTGDQTITLTGDITGSGTGSFATTYNGIVPINKGGSGQSTANTALNAFLPSQSTNSGKFLQTDGSNTSWQSASGSNPQIAYVTDQKSQGTAGGGSTFGSWLARDLNTLTTANSPSWITNNGTNNFTLDAGTYTIEVSSPYSAVGHIQTKLFNTTDSTDVILGSSENAFIGNSPIRSFIVGSFIISGTKSFQIQYQCQNTQATNGLGIAANFTTEVYTIVKITKVG